jgi:hypothetical protein
MPHFALPHVSGQVGVPAVTLALAALIVAGCAQGVSTTASAGRPSSLPTAASDATAVPGPTAPAPKTTGPTTGSILTPPVQKSGGDAISPSSTVLVASLTAQTRGVVTDRDLYGPVAVTDAAKVSHVAAVINAASRRVPAIAQCPMQGTGSLTLVFESSVKGPPAVTVTISTSGCPGMVVRPTAGGVIGLDGGPDTVKQIESILGLPWPQPAG